MTENQIREIFERSNDNLQLLKNKRNEYVSLFVQRTWIGFKDGYERARGHTLSAGDVHLGDLIKIGELIRTQDNRITDQPMFIVQQKFEYPCDPERAYGFESTRDAWIDLRESIEVDDKTSSRLEAAYLSTRRSKTKKYERICLGTVWEFVTACFTEQGCKDYLAIDGHNLNETRIQVEPSYRIYANGSYRNYEYQAVRNFLKDLPALKVV